jgi:3'-phosphoadenosine 5'-phosphosulfate (PAPS) 3'-phosphatase
LSKAEGATTQPFLAAATLIAREAGARITDFDGEKFSIWGNETLASNGPIHPEMLEVLAQLKSSMPP